MSCHRSLLLSVTAVLRLRHAGPAASAARAAAALTALLLVCIAKADCMVEVAHVLAPLSAIPLLAVSLMS